ncbi:MAG: sugar phosphate isomerase/epimerase [Roseburia sp.]|jgi:protein FrlC|nr:sugar phosphate isomerase/epimerase [Roseburia sp.]
MKTIDMENYCVLTAPFLHHTLEYGLDAIAANGFCSIELWGASPHFCADDYTPSERAARIREIRRLLSERGLKMAVFHPEQCRQYPVNIASPEAYIRRNSMRVMEMYLEDTAAFGTDKMILAPGWEYVDDQREENRERAAESIRILAEKAARLGITLIVEEMEETVTLFTRDLAHLKRLIREVGEANVMAGLDLSLALRRGESIGDYRRTFGQIGHMHVSGPDDLRAEGNGIKEDGGTAGLTDLFRENGGRYEGVISLALWGADYYVDPDAALRKVTDQIRAESRMG